MPHDWKNLRSKLRNLSRLNLPALMATALAAASWSQGAEVDFRGKVVDARGAGVAGATVKLLESALSSTTDAQGAFALQGTVSDGIVRKALLPGNLRLRFRDGVLTVTVPADGRLRMDWISPDGARRLVPASIAGVTARADLDKLAGPAAGTHWLRIATEAGVSTFRFLRPGKGAPGLLMANTGTGRADAAAGAVVARQARAAAPGLVLEVSASGYLGKRFARSAPVEAGLSLALLPGTATLKERIQDFIGAANTLRLAFLKPEAPGARKHILHYADLAEMNGDTMPQHAFADSRGPASSVYGAFAPSWSPDGRIIAYETGWENLTTPVSRIYLQPLDGARRDGPAYPSTNARWWTDGKDTTLVWCTSGKEDAWADTASATFRQKVSGGQLSGAPEMLSKGSYNAGLSPDGRYLATAFRYGLILDRETREKRFLHVYPGHPKASDGTSTDSLQACNGSVSQDPAHPSRMLFLDFGVPDEPSYANGVTPRLYAQHRMILIGDHASDAPGRIVDFIDTPPAELARENTWDDPEWTNAADFAVATIRDPDGDKTVPSEPKPTQPDIYLIKLSTKESLKVFSGGHQVLPAAWIGPKN